MGQHGTLLNGAVEMKGQRIGERLGLRNHLGATWEWRVATGHVVEAWTENEREASRTRRCGVVNELCTAEAQSELQGLAGVGHCTWGRGGTGTPQLGVLSCGASEDTPNVRRP